MTELSLGFLCLLGVETAVLVVLVRHAMREDASIEMSVHILRVLFASAMVNSLYGAIWLAARGVSR